MPRQRPEIPTTYGLWRKYVLERDNYTCQECGEYFTSNCVHHIKSYIDYPKLRLDISNGITLCENCHKNKHRQGWRKELEVQGV